MPVSELLEARSLFTETRPRCARGDRCAGRSRRMSSSLAGDEIRAQELLEANCSALERLGSARLPGDPKGGPGRRPVPPRPSRRGRRARAGRAGRGRPPTTCRPSAIALTVQARVLARSGSVRRGRAACGASRGSSRPYGHPQPESGLPAGLRRGTGVGRQIGRGRLRLIERAVDLYRLKENDVGAARAQALLAAAI